MECFDSRRSQNTEARMAGATHIHSASIFQTIDEFMAAVPWDEWRTVLVYHRVHGGRAYIRIRTWNRHREKEVWYPTDRSFIIPVGNAEALATALRAAARQRATPKPDWLVAREEAENGKLEWMEDMQAPDDVLANARRKLRRRRRRRV